MIGYLELISDKSLGPLTSEQTHALSVLKKSYHRLQSLIDNLLQFSLVSQSDMSLHLEPVSIQSLFQRALSRSQSKAHGQNINLKVIVPPDPPNVQADGEKIAWVLEQLLDNSIKFNTSNGKVSLSAKVVDTKVTIAVSDTGVGIPEEKIGEIFEDFHQLDGTTTRKHGGTGLGLSLVQRILEAHGTEVKVLSKIGEGSHFEFQLPISY
jgi:signal transduction histidine kinase